MDGVSRGHGSQTLSLTTVAHQMEVRKSGFLSSTSTVTPRLGLEQALNVTLLTEAQQRAARTPSTIRAHGSIEMRLMPVGHFTMGSTRREPGRRANEGQRPVELRRHVLSEHARNQQRAIPRISPGTQVRACSAAFRSIWTINPWRK